MWWGVRNKNLLDRTPIWWVRAQDWLFFKYSDSILTSIQHFYCVQRFFQSDGTVKSKMPPAPGNFIGSAKLVRSPVLVTYKKMLTFFGCARKSSWYFFVPMRRAITQKPLRYTCCSNILDSFLETPIYLSHFSKLDISGGNYRRPATIDGLLST